MNFQRCCRWCSPAWGCSSSQMPRAAALRIQNATMTTQITLQFDPMKWGCCDTFCRDFYPLRDRSGIYAIYGIQTDEFWRSAGPDILCYIGISRNLRKRLELPHEALDEARRKFRMAKRRIQECPLDLAKDLEYLLIKKFNPPMNTQHRGIL